MRSVLTFFAMSSGIGILNATGVCGNSAAVHVLVSDPNQLPGFVVKSSYDVGYVHGLSALIDELSSQCGIRRWIEFLVINLDDRIG